ncbi:MBL fold metallo-hydrolase [Roseibium aggregatum]|uniref:MBL fold metallo-hydrolase n=1 Tax=Roseibium aggregatum TaxID=187304 RepID=A0A939J2U0_9HYPH|nr:MBL fold metallo-hydrolase [Roseibium aggregatum]MBN9671773.1 MBL fold metallo-hydrolase [Roseibium aggregatum]
MKRRNFLKSAGATALAAPALLSATSSSRGNAPENETRLEITWLGGATMLIAFGGLTLLTDPAFGDGKEAFRMGDPNEMFDLSKGPNVVFHERLTPFPGVDLGRVDYVVLSHMHEDHFDQKAEQSIPKDMPFFVPAHDTARLSAKGFTNVRQADWGRSFVLNKGEVEISLKAIPADHSEDPEIARLLGPGNGYWLTFRNGNWTKTVYWTGDTFPTPRVLDAVRPLGTPDIFIPHMGGVGTTGALGQISMSAHHVADFVEALKPRKVLPLHHSTFALYLEPVAGLPAALEDKTHGLDLVSEGTCLGYS